MYNNELTLRLLLLLECVPLLSGVKAELSNTLESLASMEAKEAVVRQRHRAKAATMR
jgi:hypothetical protein